MKNIVLTYLPFCTPASPSYSLTALQSFLEANCAKNKNIKLLDLNILFHTHKFPEFKKYYKNQEQWKDYAKTTEEFLKISNKTYSQNNFKVVKGNEPEFFKELLTKIILEAPDIVAFSIVYSSQAFFARSMLKALKELGITTVIGGPAINAKLISLATHSFSNDIEFLEFIENKKIKHEDLNFNSFPDFSIWNLNDYFTPKIVIPLKTTSTCFYQKCAFCAHYAHVPYNETDINHLKKTIITSKQKHFFLIDDMIKKRRLLQFAEMIKPLKCYWTCQLRPTKDLDYKTLKILKESGLRMVLWGVESGNERILNLIKKGTNPKDISTVLQNAFDLGISNVTYTMFGFPGETKEEFLQTISFLEKNEKYIDLVSSALFGLQYNTIIFNNPEKYGITKIIEKERTVLNPKILYEVASGLTHKDAAILKKRNQKRLDKINKFPKSMNFFREHMLCSLTNNNKKHLQKNK